MDIPETPVLLVRAGFWQRGLAFSIDSLIISALFQLTVAALFVATSGRVQTYGEFTYRHCSMPETAPDRSPQPIDRAHIARKCDFYFLGAQTASILVGSVGEEGTSKTSADFSRIYRLDRDGRRIDAVSADWIAALALLGYLIIMETRIGATLGKLAIGIRVIDAAASASRKVPLRKVVVRYLAMLIGFIPILSGPVEVIPRDLFSFETGSHLFEWRPYFLNLPQISMRDIEPRLDESAAVEVSGWLFSAAAFGLDGLAIFLIAQIARKVDPLYDRLAGVAVVSVV